MNNESALHGADGSQGVLSLCVEERAAPVRNTPQPPRTPPCDLTPFCAGFPSMEVGRRGLAVHADCFEWLRRVPSASIHAVVTDPPYGVKEFEADQLAKRDIGVGGIWRLPPAFDGSKRAPMPRFTALNGKERQHLLRHFTEWTTLLHRVLVPGAHVFIACNTFLSQLVYQALVNGGLEYRGEVVRLVRTFRGGDRPKNYDKEFPDLCTLPRGGFEPWGLFRKALPEGMTVGECLRQFRAGALRRVDPERPFSDVIPSERTPGREKEISDHPSLKPQSFMRQVVHAALPFDDGVLLDPFMGSGSTIAAAEALGLTCVAVERHADYFNDSKAAIPRLAAIPIRANVDYASSSTLSEFPTELPELA